MSAEQKNNLIPMAEIVGVHGIKGAVKLKIFAEDPENLGDYGTMTDAEGKRDFDITRIHAHGSIFLAEIAGVTDREAAEKLRGTALCIARDRLRAIKKKNTYYHVDLIGLAAKRSDGSDLGRVIAVANFGAGDLLDIKPAKGPSFYVPFTNEAVPDVNIDGGTITVDPPAGLLD